MWFHFDRLLVITDAGYDYHFDFGKGSVHLLPQNDAALRLRYPAQALI